MKIHFFLFARHIAATKGIENFQFTIFNALKIQIAPMDLSQSVGAFVFS